MTPNQTDTLAPPRSRAPMSQDFGWRRSGESYVKAYGRALELRVDRRL